MSDRWWLKQATMRMTRNELAAMFLKAFGVSPSMSLTKMALVRQIETHRANVRDGVFDNAAASASARDSTGEGSAPAIKGKRRCITVRGAITAAEANEHLRTLPRLTSEDLQ